MKKRIVLAVLITALVTLITMFVVFALLLRPKPLKTAPIDMSIVEDGRYVGVCQNKILLAVVEVEVKSHQIVSVQILAHKESYMIYAIEIANAIVVKQSVEVDGISGATFTSDTVKKATENALLQGDR